MEMELEPRVKPLGYKVKGMSRESPSQKGSHVLDSDLRSYWSPGTNTKEWILLELDEPCLLSHIRIYNKSVLEWEISVGLRYKPETFVKVRPRCEAPRRDIMYPMNYTPCRYVRISCLRGNPIAIFFIQLIGIPVIGLEAEFQPVVNHLLPDIISHKQDTSNMHLQLLQEITNRLLVFVPQLEADLASFTDAPEQSLRFLAMLAGPFYPILHVVKERERARTSSNISDVEVSKSSQSSSLITVSSNFEPRRPRGMFHILSTSSSSLVFRPDAVFTMLRKAYKDSDLGTVCKMASRILHKLVEPVAVHKASQSGNDVSSALDDTPKSDLPTPVLLVDYSSLFGEEYQMPNDEWDSSIFNLLDIGAVEEGILHVLFACASQPLFCRKLAENASEFWSALPLVQALLPVLRPSVNNLSDSVDDSFSFWKQPFIQQALSEIVSTSCSASYQPLLHACAGYLSSYSSSHVKAASILLDLCSSVLAPWMSQVVAKVDLAVELLEDLLGAIQGASHCLVRARAAVKYIILAISGHMDDILGKYKEAKHKILFLLEMLEPFLDPAIYASKSSIAFGDVSFSFLEKQEQSCMIALNIIRIAVEKPAVLPALETEWRRGLVPPSVLLSILEPHMQLPPEIDMCKSPVNKDLKHEASAARHSSALGYGGASLKTNNQDEMDGKIDISDTTAKIEICEDASLYFAPLELRNMAPTSISSSSNENVLETDHKSSNSEVGHLIEKKLNHLFNNGIVLDVGFATEYFNSQVDYFQLINYHDCELRASDFRRLAVDLQMQNEIADEAHHTAVDALLLAAECYVNPFFLMPLRINSKLENAMSISRNRHAKFGENFKLSAFKKTGCDIETISILEKKRDKIVLELLLEAANLDRKFQSQTSDEGLHEGIEEQVLKLFPNDIQYADAITLLRQNQALLCTFLIERLKKDRQSMHEILLHCLVFLLHSATRLYCTPEEVIDIILQSAEYLNTMLTSFYGKSKEGSLHLDPEKVHWIQRRWMLLQRMVIASSGNEGSDFSVNIKNGYRCGKLIPPLVWIQRIPMFSCSAYPLVRFVGWMAVSRNAQHYTKEGLALASDLSQLTCLLSIYGDELTAVENIINRKYEVQKKEFSEVKQDLPVGEVLEPANQQHVDQSFRVLYPYLCKFFPNMKRQFESFGENILVAVGLQLRSLSSAIVPDILCWFSDLCSWPFLQGSKIASQNCSRYLKGYVSKNAKAIILYILEAIVVEHMEAMVPEIPRVMQVLISLCRAPYFDVSFLDSIMSLLKPIILHALHKVSDEEINMVEESCHNFESLCFGEVFVAIRWKSDGDKPSEHDCNHAMLIFILACVFTDLSFRNKRDILQSLAPWANFTNFEPSASFHDYLKAFQAIFGSCKVLLVQSLKSVNAIPLQMPYNSDADTVSLSNNILEAESWFLNDVCSSSTPHQSSDKPGNDKCDAVDSKKKDYCLTVEDIEGFSADLENIISKLIPNIERCWNLHSSLARNLTIVSAECSMYLKCLSKTMSQHQIADEGGSENSEHKPIAQFPVHWKVALAGLAETVLELQNSHCWEVASVMLDCLLGVPNCFLLDNVVDTICSAVKCFCYCAPKMSWRLKSDEWLSSLLARVAHDLQEGHRFLSDLFVALLDHCEPEQRFIALQHLGRLVGHDINGESVFEPSKYCNKLISPKAVAEPFLSDLVSSTWDKVILLASSDTLLSLRTRALVLLIGYIPYAERHQLQTFLSVADTVLPILGKILYPACEGPMLRLSLALVLGACLYSPAEDVSLIPQDVWRNIETIGLSTTGGHFDDLEKNACKVLCRLRDEGEEAKEPLKEVLASGFPKQADLKFMSTRETILQVLSDLTTVESYFDVFSKKIEENEMELEEAEIELEILQKENAAEEFSKGTEQEIPLAIASVKGDNRLQQIKEQINSIEKAKLQQHILARRQKKLFMRHARRKYIEEAALREEELLRELDREKTAEAEKEIERQKLLELERAKTREFRHNLDMEKERQTQRDLQHELEQVAETGLRSSRRDFSTSTHSRSRDRYRERENGRSSTEGIARTGSASLPPEISSTSSSLTMPTVVLSGSRSFSGQAPTILQSRDRSDEGGSSYEENFDGSKDSGDTGSVGEPDLISGFDTQSGGYGSAQRHGSRGSRSRQVMERRERDGRREGKWERKHS